ncbi:MAG: hypothetical protein E6J20_19855 [Chloroflexi bacterium]|nr:MAG: hypothetical protein E6J20_19855 [Chloroflexota bacterium]
MSACPHCQAAVPGDARFCPACGREVVPAATCTGCGRGLDPGTRFCPGCGTPVAQSAATSSPATAAAQPAQERRLISAIFLDLVNSTALGEHLDGEVLTDLMAAYFAALRAEIEAAGGRVEKFIGDAVVGVFGLPRAHEDDAARALRAAVAIRQRLPELNAELTAQFGVAVQVHTGINTGEVVVAEVSSAEELGMVTGDVLNVAARLEASSAPGQIVVSARTVAAVRGFEFRPLGPLSLKGRAEPVASFELLREDPDATVSGLPDGAAMVGRETELALLQSVYERTAATHRGHLVTVLGEMGMGKTRLVTELVRWARALHDGPQILQGHFLSYGVGGSRRGLADLLRARAGIVDDTAAATAERIRVSVAAMSGDDEATGANRQAALLARSAGLADAADLSAEPPERVHDQTVAAWAWFARTLGAQRPAIVVLDDAQWADDAVLDVLERALVPDDSAVVVVVAARDELLQRRPAWAAGRTDAVHLTLTPLDAAESARLLGLLVPAETPDAATLTVLVEHCDGNPFFLEELIRHLAAAGQIRHDESGWTVAPGAASELADLPDSIEEAIEARLDRLSHEERRALQYAAVVGRVFWDGPVAEVLAGLPGTPDSAASVLDRLERQGLIAAHPGSAFVGEREYAFRHTLAHDVAYRTLPQHDRGPAHEQVAAWLERRDPDGGHDDVLAAHHLAAYRSARQDTRTPADKLEQLRAGRRASGRRGRRPGGLTPDRLSPRSSSPPGRS